MEKDKTKELENCSQSGFDATSEQKIDWLLGGQESHFFNCQYAVICYKIDEFLYHIIEVN